MPSKRRGELHAVVFELELPASLKSFVFADISYMSKMIDEQEILFDIGTTFIVTSVAFNDVEQNWVIRLTGTDKGHDIVTKEYIDFYRERMNALTPTIKLGEFLIIVGQYEKARVYFNDLLKLHDQDDVYILYKLAWIDKCQGKYRQAREKLDCAYDKENTNDLPSQQKLRDILNDIGTLHVVMDEHEQALNYYQQAVKISSSPAVFNNIGLAYKIQGRYKEALEYFNKAHEVSNREWPSGHYDIGITLDNIGQTYNYQGEYLKALDYHLKALHLKQQTLPDYHMDIGISLNNVGFTYNNLGEYDEALTYYHRALQVYQQCLPEIHLEIAMLLDNMATVYYYQSQYSKGLEYLYKALHIEEHIEPINRMTLGRTLNNLGVTLVAHKLNDEDNDKEALDCFRRALAMYEANGSANSSDAAISLYQQGKLHHRRKEYYQAHELYEQALNIQRSVLPENHSATLKTQATLIQLKTELESNEKKDISS
jgi:tetratricopeptide (TPR) repeat protein